MIDEQIITADNDRQKLVEVTKENSEKKNKSQISCLIESFIDPKDNVEKLSY